MLTMKFLKIFIFIRNKNIEKSFLITFLFLNLLIRVSKFSFNFTKFSLNFFAKFVQNFCEIQISSKIHQNSQKFWTKISMETLLLMDGHLPFRR